MVLIGMTLFALLCIAAAIIFALMALNAAEDKEYVSAVLCAIVAFLWFCIFISILTEEDGAQYENPHECIVDKISETRWEELVMTPTEGNSSVAEDLVDYCSQEVLYLGS